MTYKIIATGDKNAYICHDSILIDVGVPFSWLKDVYKNIEVVLLTHIHGDHFNKTAIKKLRKELPNMILGIPEHLEEEVLKLGIEDYNILEVGKLYAIGEYQISPVRLYHNVPNVGYRIIKGSHKTLHATDTSTFNGIIAKGYDVYAIEGNWCENYIYEKLNEQRENGEYAHGYNSMNNHASVQHAHEYFESMRSEKSELILLHRSSTYTKEI